MWSLPRLWGTWFLDQNWFLNFSVLHEALDWKISTRPMMARLLLRSLVIPLPSVLSKRQTIREEAHSAFPKCPIPQGSGSQTSACIRITLNTYWTAGTHPTFLVLEGAQEFAFWMSPRWCRCYYEQQPQGTSLSLIISTFHFCILEMCILSNNTV